jgi:hypothetical protein
MRKTRSDCILLHLPEEQQAQLAEWLLSGVPYHKAKELLEKQFQVQLRSLSVFKVFWEEVCVPHLLRRRALAVQTANAVAESVNVAQRGERFDEATIAALKQKAFELAISPGQDPEAVKAVFSLVLKARDQDLDAEKLKLDRAKFEFDAAKRAMEEAAKIKTIAADGALNSEEKIQRVRQVLFGIAPGK